MAYSTESFPAQYTPTTFGAFNLGSRHHNFSPAVNPHQTDSSEVLVTLQEYPIQLFMWDTTGAEVSGLLHLSDS